MQVLTINKIGCRSCFLFASIAALLVISSGVSHARKVDTGEPMVHYPDSVIEFSRHCADENPYTVQAYALFRSADGHTRALVAPWAGYRGIDGKIWMGGTSPIVRT